MSANQKPTPPAGPAAGAKKATHSRGLGVGGHKVGKLSELHTSRLKEVPQDEAPETAEDNGIPKNEFGGVLVTDKEIQAAFDVLDMDKNGFISLNNLKKRLGVFFPDMTAKEYRFLMNNQKEMTFDDLHELLASNTITNFDPVAEAFKLYDPEDHGYINPKVLQEIFKVYGFGDVSTEDVEILGKAADVNGDGKITLEDFRKMLEGEGAVLADHAIQDHAGRMKMDAQDKGGKQKQKEKEKEKEKDGEKDKEGAEQEKPTE